MLKGKMAGNEIKTVLETLARPHRLSPSRLVSFCIDMCRYGFGSMLATRILRQGRSL